MTLGRLRSTRRTRRTLRPELVMAPGPATMGQPGAGSLGELYGDRWALAWEQASPRLLQERGGAWHEVIPGAPWPDLAGAGHLALAFDQSAHHVIAWSAAAGLYVRQWDTLTRAYIYLGPFAGVDPCLIADAPLSGDVAGSDVVLWHLSPDRAQLCYRLQRDLYRVAYPVAALDAGAVLDQAAALPLRLELLGELPDGQSWAVLTGLYPTYQGDTARAAGRPDLGSYTPAVGAASGAEAPVFGRAAPSGGQIRAVLMQASGAEVPVFGSAAPGAGQIRAVLMQASGAELPMAGSAAPRPGAYAVAVLRYTAPAEAPLQASGAPAAGRYGP